MADSNIPVWELSVTYKEGKVLRTAKWMVVADNKQELQRFVNANHGAEAQWTADRKNAFDLRRER